MKDSNDKKIMRKSKREIKLSVDEIHKLRTRVAELEQILNSIQSGEVDALIINNKQGESQVFTLEGEDQPYRILVESMSEGAITLDGEGKIVHCNNQFSAMVATPRKNIIGASLFEFILETQHEQLRYLLAQCKIKSCKADFYLQSNNKSVKCVLLSCHNLEFGNVDGISIVATDITELKEIQNDMTESLKEKEVMLKEIYHRVKNNMQVISSLLNLQINRMQDTTAKQSLIESSTRVKSMALVHEMLYQTKNLATIGLKNYATALFKYLFDIYAVDSKKISLTKDIDDISLSIDKAIPCGLIINELIANILKHAFPGDKSGEIKVSVKRHANQIILIVSDNGEGIPKTVDKTKSLGMTLIQGLTKQLDGKTVVKSNNGTTFTLSFPDDLR